MKDLVAMDRKISGATCCQRMYIMLAGVPRMGKCWRLLEVSSSCQPSDFIGDQSPLHLCN